MRVRVFADEKALGRAAAAQVAERLRDAIERDGKARLLAAAGPGQGAVLDALAAAPGIAWGQVELFHDAELIGLAAGHPGSLRRFLCERLVAKTRIGRCHLLDGERDPERVCRDEGEALRAAPIDVALASIGPAGELALNFAPADFALEKPCVIVRLDEAWRRARVDAEAFRSLHDVPERAITVSVRQLMKSTTVIACAVGAVTAEAVKRGVEGAVSPLAPASILQTHPDATLYLDRAAAASLAREPTFEV